MDFLASDYLRAFTLTILAGLSTGIGGLVVFRKKPLNQHIISGALGLSAGVMIYISFVEMLNGAFSTLGGIYGTKGNLFTVLAFFGGMLFSLLIDFVIPEDCNLHELHSVDKVSYDPHVEKQPESFADSVTNKHKDICNDKTADNCETNCLTTAFCQDDKKQFTRAGIKAGIAIIAHNLPEGIASFVAALADPTLGVGIAIAIAIHNIPEGITVAVPLYAGTGNKRYAFLFALFSGLAEPLGALLAWLILGSVINDAIMGIIFAFIAGIMVFISLDELLPMAEKQGEHHIVIAGVFVGMLIMAFSLLVI